MYLLSAPNDEKTVGRKTTYKLPKETSDFKYIILLAACDRAASCTQTRRRQLPSLRDAHELGRLGLAGQISVNYGVFVE